MEISVSKSITITLTEKEAMWLKDFIQNHPDMDNESSHDASIRESLLIAIIRFEENHK